MNVYDYFKELNRRKRTKDLLNEHLMPQEFHVSASKVNIGGAAFSTPTEIQNHGGFIAALNHKRQYLIIILTIIIVIIEHLFI